MPARLLLLSALTASLCACGDGNSGTGSGGGGGGGGPGTGGHSASSGTDGTTSGAGMTSSGTGVGTGTGGGADGCVAPPQPSFNPLAGYKAPAKNPTVVVTSVSDSGPGSLRAAVASAAPGGVIGVAANLAGQTITLSSTIELGGSITLDGSAAPGITIDGANQVALFHFNGDAPTKIALFSLRFINGHTPGSGGAISLNGGAIDLEIGGCTFEGNASSEGGAIRVGYAKNTSAFIHDSIFKNNDGSVPGGGNGFSGGAVSTTGTNLHVARCRFEGNHGPITGALYTIHSDPLVEDSVFLDNSTTSPDHGSGAFFADGGGPGDDNNPGTIPGQVTIRRSRFEHNQGAESDGGGIMLWGYPMDVFTIESSVLRDNHCAGGGKGGGARLHARNKLRIVQTAFVDNVSDQQGGGLWLDGEGPFELENVLFSGNQAVGDRGGGATLNTHGKVVLSHVTFVENAAKNGCGAFWLPDMGLDVRLKNSILAGNTGANSWEVQTGYPPIDDGGNIEFPLASGGTPAAEGGLHVDPKLGALVELSGMLVRPLDTGSPALDHGLAAGAPLLDIRGAKRDAKPDSGSFEVGAACGP